MRIPGATVSLVRLMALLLVFLHFGCREDEPFTPVEPGPEVNQPYGTPFGEVPAVEDIILYEANLRAMSAAGDLQGVIDRLDHIQDLGVNVLWLMPIYPTGRVNSVNSPYSVRDYQAVGAEYGTLEDLRRLTDEAHARGIAVLLDWVANHTAWDHPWIADPTWYTRDSGGDIVHPPGTNWRDVADLNFDNTDMRAAMIEAMKYWIEAANIDGFRCDYADGVPFDFWRQAWEELTALPGRNLILFAEGERNDHFAAGFDLNFGWQSYGALKQVFDGQPAGRIFTAHRAEYANLPAGKHWVRFTTNHDESAWDATPVRLFNGVDGALAASVVSLFTGGVPLIYGSQEVGTAGNVPFFSNSLIDWNGNPALLSAYQTLLNVYAGSPAARKGELVVFPDVDVVSFSKRLGNDEIIILVNVRNTPVNYALPTGLENTAWVDVISQTEVVLEGELRLSPYQFFVLKQQ